jgi:hypothetical protein
MRNLPSLHLKQVRSFPTGLVKHGSGRVIFSSFESYRSKQPGHQPDSSLFKFLRIRDISVFSFLFSCANFWILLNSLSPRLPFPPFQLFDISFCTSSTLSSRLRCRDNDIVIMGRFQQDRIFIGRRTLSWQ